MKALCAALRGLDKKTRWITTSFCKLDYLRIREQEGKAIINCWAIPTSFIKLIALCLQTLLSRHPPAPLKFDDDGI